MLQHQQLLPNLTTPCPLHGTYRVQHNTYRSRHDTCLERGRFVLNQTWNVSRQARKVSSQTRYTSCCCEKTHLFWSTNIPFQGVQQPLICDCHIGNWRGSQFCFISLDTWSSITYLDRHRSNRDRNIRHSPTSVLHHIPPPFLRFYGTAIFGGWRWRCPRSRKAEEKSLVWVVTGSASGHITLHVRVCRCPGGA